MKFTNLYRLNNDELLGLYEHLSMSYNMAIGYCTEQEADVIYDELMQIKEELASRGVKTIQKWVQGA